MRESSVEKKLREFATTNGCMYIKLSGENQKGQPDRFVLRQGRIMFLELKAPGKKPTPLQEKWIADLTAQGFTAVWTDNVGEGMDLIERHLIP